MKSFLGVLVLSTLSTAAAEHKIAVIGLVHSPAWRQLSTMVSGKPAKLAGVAEKNPALVEEAIKAGVPSNLIFSDYEQMLDTQKPEIVWAFVENDRHLEIARGVRNVPRVEDHSTIVLHWTNGSGIFEGSWDLPRSFQELEIFGRDASAYVANGKLEARKGREDAVNREIAPLPAERAEPIASMIHAIESGKGVEGHRSRQRICTHGQARETIRQVRKSQ